MEVVLLSHTQDPLTLLYISCRQCYSDKFAPELVDEVDDNKKASFIKEVLKSGHRGVVEHVKFTFAIRGVSRALTHQLVRHRIASYLQSSQRYIDLKAEFNIDNFVVPHTVANNSNAYGIYNNILNDIQHSYNKLRNLGIPKEDARYVLPNAIKTSIILTMNCSALLHFFSLRCCNNAQWEIRELAYKILSLCKDVFPAVFEDSGSICESLGYCPEPKKRSCGKFPLKSEVIK